MRVIGKTVRKLAKGHFITRYLMTSILGNSKMEKNLAMEYLNTQMETGIPNCLIYI